MKLNKYKKNEFYFDDSVGRNCLLMRGTQGGDNNTLILGRCDGHSYDNPMRISRDDAVDLANILMQYALTGKISTAIMPKASDEVVANIVKEDSGKSSKKLQEENKELRRQLEMMKNTRPGESSW